MTGVSSFCSGTKSCNVLIFFATVYQSFDLFFMSSWYLFANSSSFCSMLSLLKIRSGATC